MIKISKDKKTVIHNGERIEIIKYIGREDTDDVFESIHTNKYKHHTKFALLPMSMNGKIRWFRNVKITKQLYFGRICPADESISSFTNYWQEMWVTVDVN